MRLTNSLRNLTSFLVALSMLLAASILIGRAPSVQAGEFPVAAAPGAITWSNDGRYAYFSPSTFSAGSGYIKRLDLSNGSVTDILTIPDPAGCHGHVTTLALTPDDSILLAGGYSCAFTIPLSNPSSYTSTYTGADWGQQISVGSDSAYIVGSQNGIVYKISKVGGIWGPTWTSSISKPGAVSRSLALNPSGSTLYVASEGTDVRVVDTSADPNTESALAGSGPAFALALSPDGSYLLVLDGARGLKRVELTGGSAGTVTSASFGADWGLRGISIDSSGTYAYIAAVWSRALLKVRTSDLTQVDSFSFAAAYPSSTTATVDALAASPVSGSDQVLVSSSALSQIISFPSTASAPRSLSVSPGDDSAEVTFTAPENGFSAITNYEYRLDGAGSWTALAPADTTSPVTVPGLTNGTSVGIELRAVNAQGAGTASSSVTVTPQSTPRTPRNVRITPSSRQISISFSAPESDGGFAITNYEVSTDNGATWQTQSPAVTSGPIVITGLTNGVQYLVSIRAVNALGSGSGSAPAGVTPNPPSSGSGSAVVVPDPTPTASATPTPSATSSSSSNVTTPPSVMIVPQSVPVGQGIVVIDGRTTKVEVKSVAGRSWQVQGEDFTLEFIPQALSGELDGSFTARAGAKVIIRGDGFAPNTLIASYLPGALADSLGQSRVNSDGTFEVEASIPDVLTAGQYVFQVNGLGSSTTVRSVNLGMQLLPSLRTLTKAPSVKVRFPSGSADVAPVSAKKLASFLKAKSAKAASVLIVPTVGIDATRGDVRLARQRAASVKAELRDLGFTKPVRIAAGVRRVDDPLASSQMTIWLQSK